ncbi:MAG: hypothetical protein KDA96_20315 [Planctomycetaceae bacterium]|nr:hypothetical protein [Planctomycetaceae bacterium]
MTRRLLAAAVAVGVSPICLACINDNELPQHEREFRSQYLDSRLTEAQSPVNNHDARHIAMTGTGVGLLVVGLAFAWRKKAVRPITDSE